MNLILCQILCAYSFFGFWLTVQLFLSFATSSNEEECLSVSAAVETSAPNVTQFDFTVEYIAPGIKMLMRVKVNLLELKLSVFPKPKLINLHI